MNSIVLPKIELHCHLDGSVRPETIIDIAKEEDIKLPSYEVEEIKEMLIAPIDCISLDEYLEKFQIPIKVMQSKESLRRITFEVFEDAAKENIKYMEVRFAPLFHIKKGLKVDEVLDSVLKGIKDAEKQFDIKGNLILSFLRTMSVESIYEVIECGRKYLGEGIVAVDLCGPEHKDFCKNFVEPISLAKRYGYRVTIHAGETGIGKNVLDAVELLGAERIGHGVFIKDHEEAYNVVKNNNITLEMCPTSNVQTKAVSEYKNHPIYDFFKDGIRATLNTDNRTVSNITLSNEYDVISKEFKITLEDYKKLYNYSIDAIFADEETKKWLKNFN